MLSAKIIYFSTTSWTVFCYHTSSFFKDLHLFLIIIAFEEVLSILLKVTIFFAKSYLSIGKFCSRKSFSNLVKKLFSRKSKHYSSFLTASYKCFMVLTREPHQLFNRFFNKNHWDGGYSPC